LENSQDEVTFEILEEEYKRLIHVNCSLTWDDDPSQYLAGTNEPDEFKVAIIAPNGDTVAESSMTSNSEGGSGIVRASSPRLDYTEEDFKDNYFGIWTIQIEAGDCGDDYARPNLFGIVRSTSDTGNEWTLNYTITHLVEDEE
jgi:hypothetical protein